MMEIVAPLLLAGLFIVFGLSYRGLSCRGTGGCGGCAGSGECHGQAGCPRKRDEPGASAS